jgi:hypothetical protein
MPGACAGACAKRCPPLWVLLLLLLLLAVACCYLPVSHLTDSRTQLAAPSLALLRGQSL